MLDADWGALMRVVGGVTIDRAASEVWAYVADYGSDANWRAGVSQMRPSQPGPAEVGVTTHELLRLLGPLRPLEPLVAWLLRRQSTADLRRLKHLLDGAPGALSGPRTSTL